MIHSGIYYQPGSLKARYCRQGKQLLEDFCQQHHIQFEQPGKLISAVVPGQEEMLQGLAVRAEQNGVEHLMLNAREARGKEPRLKSHGALEVPGTGIVDYSQVTRALVEQSHSRGSQIYLDSKVLQIRRLGERIELTTSQGQLDVDGYVNCAGLHSDRLARKAGVELDARVVPFRGEYYRLAPASAEGLSGRLIYPLPDPRFPFLGVHLTPKMTGEFLAGPNAVLAFARQGYSWRHISLPHLWRLFTFPGFLRLAANHWRFGLQEMVRSLSKTRFTQSLGRLVEGINAWDLAPAASGVRAQLVSRDGRLVDDFSIQESPGGIHVLNAPSPAATASLMIGQAVAERAIRAFA